jgi:hypothetical protein
MHYIHSYDFKLSKEFTKFFLPEDNKEKWYSTKKNIWIIALKYKTIIVQLMILFPRIDV